MPRPGVPNNPSGANGVEDPATGQTSVAGLVNRPVGINTALQTPAQQVPKRAQRQATRPATAGQPGGTAAAAAPQPPPAPLPYPVMLAKAWTDVASIPGASPLVQQLAQEARQGVQ